MAHYRTCIIIHKEPWLLGVEWQLRKYTWWNRHKGILIDTDWAPDEETAMIRADGALRHHLRGDLL